jgi:hypothetical protein
MEGQHGETWSSMMGVASVPSMGALGGYAALYAGDWKMEKLDSSMQPLSLFLAVPDYLEGRIPYLSNIRYARVS